MLWLSTCTLAYTAPWRMAVSLVTRTPLALRRLTGLNQKSLPGLRSSSVRIRLVNISGPL